jgi:hypothetical protein
VRAASRVDHSGSFMRLRYLRVVLPLARPFCLMLRCSLPRLQMTPIPHFALPSGRHEAPAQRGGSAGA